MLSRARVTVVLAALLGLSLQSLDAQTPPGVPRVGVLASTSPTVYEPFLKALHELGWTPGRNLVLEIRAADGQLDRLSALAAQLVQARIDLIVAPALPHARAALAATRTIPIKPPGRSSPRCPRRSCPGRTASSSDRPPGVPA